MGTLKSIMGESSLGNILSMFDLIGLNYFPVQLFCLLQHILSSRDKGHMCMCGFSLRDFHEVNLLHWTRCALLCYQTYGFHGTLFDLMKLLAEA